MDIVCEFRASNALLRSLSRFPAGLPTVSRREAGRIQGLLRTNRIHTLALAELAEAVDESHFNDEEKVSLLNAIANTSTETHAPVGAIEHNRTKSQDWSRVIHKLLPDTVWKSMVNAQVDHLFHFLGLLGLRLPDERTFRSMTIAYLWASLGSAKFASMSSCARLVNLRALKKMWASSYIAKLPKPECWIPIAPDDIATFKSKFPTAWSAAFGDEDPAPQPMTDMDWSVNVAMTKCRSSKFATPMQGRFDVVPMGSPNPLEVHTQTMNALAGITQLVAAITNGEPQQPPASSPTSDATLTLLDDYAKTQPSREVLAPKADAADHQHYRVELAPQDGAADQQASCEVLAQKDGDDMAEIVDALTANLVKPGSRRPLLASFKKPASSASTLKRPAAASTLKRPAAADVPYGWTRVTPTPDRVPKGWTAWAIPRGDKIYIDANGKRYRSMKEIEKAIR